MVVLLQQDKKGKTLLFWSRSTEGEPHSHWDQKSMFPQCVLNRRLANIENLCNFYFLKSLLEKCVL